MRKLFIAAAKVFGLLQVYYGLAYVTSIIPFVTILAGAASNTAVDVTTTSFAGENMSLTLVSLLATIVLTFGVAWLLLFRTAWLADKFNFPEEQEIGGLDKDSILIMGVTLIGLYVTTQAGPALVSACFRPSYYGSGGFSSILPTAFKLAFGLLFAIRPRMVLSLLARGEKTDAKRIVIGVFVILTLLFVLGKYISNYQFKSLHEYSSSRTFSSDSVFVPQERKTNSSNQWYSFDETTPHAGTNENRDFTKATIRDVVDFLKTEQGTAEQNPAPYPEPHTVQER